MRAQLLRWDTDGNGVIDRFEWCAALPVALGLVGSLTSVECGKLFDAFDQDGNGTLDFQVKYHLSRSPPSLAFVSEEM